MQFKIISMHKKTFLEESQEVPLAFAFAKIDKEKGTVEAQHAKVLCRDFLLDTLIWQENPKTYYGPIYQYNFRGPVDPTPTLLLWNVQNPDLSRLHIVEEMFNVTPSQLFATNRQKQYVIVGDPFWYKSTVYLSFWTYCIRYLLGTDKYSLHEPIPCEQSKFLPMKTETDILSCAKKLSVLNKNPKSVRSYPADPIHGPNGFMACLNHPSHTNLTAG